ncbi:MAG TPA: hypothetical protein VM141_12095, partial [Planctomycetota bacterium]|nr:hypothetical protein [Planctomycetota bacterium]
MNTAFSMVCCVFAFSASAIAAELQIPHAATGGNFVSDVDAVMPMLNPTDEQNAKIDQAKKEFSDSRERLLADLVEQFTKKVGNP